MRESVHTMNELRMRQSLPLSIKIAMTQTRMREWVDFYGLDGVYISFSGGKDSTVLVDIFDKTFPNNDVPLVFLDTGLEYPEIREFVKGYGERVVWLKPEMQFKKVIETYGYPFISKEVSNVVRGARMGQITRIQKLNGEYLKKDGTKSGFNKKKWKFMLDAPFEVGSYCCDVMKKKPFHQYEKQTKRKPIMAMMADESLKRTTAWMHTGCNAWDIERPQSNPIATWTEQDVLLYIKQNNLPICSVYGDIIEDFEKTNQVDGQMNLLEFQNYDIDHPLLKTTGCNRTGCMFCGYGCYFPDDNRFEQMKQTHPKQYEWIMKPWSEGGLGYKEIIDWLNENGNLHIRY